MPLGQSRAAREIGDLMAFWPSDSFPDIRGAVEFHGGRRLGGRDGV